MSDTATEARVLWRAVKKHFRVITTPVDSFFHSSSYRLVGADLLPGLLDGKRAQAIAGILAGAAPATLETLTAMARVNVERTNDAFKAVALTYVTLPLAFAALLSDAAPEETRRLLERIDPNDILIILAWLLLAPAIYFISHWRAKQIAWSIELFRAGALALPPR